MKSRAMVGTLLTLTLGAAARIDAQVIPDRLVGLPQMAALTAAPAGTEITVSWSLLFSPAGDPAGPGAVNQFAVAGRRSVPDGPPLERNPQVSEDRLVVVALDAAGREVGWQLVPDPSIVRAEVPGPSGELTGRVLRRPETSFLITLPDTNPPVASVRVLKPRWTGGDYVLDQLGTIAIQ